MKCVKNKQQEKKVEINYFYFGSMMEQRTLSKFDVRSGLAHTKKHL